MVYLHLAFQLVHITHRKVYRYDSGDQQP